MNGQVRTKCNRRHFLASTISGASLIALHPFTANAAVNQAHLRIMETTDLHVHVHPYDYYSDRPIDTVGLARTASHIKTIRAEAANSLLLDNGDFLQGNPMGDYIAYERGMKEGDLHPVIAAMNTVGFDATTLGNHEFNYGLDFLMKSLAGANFPVLSANVVKKTAGTATNDTPLVKPYVLLDRELTDGSGAHHKIKIGLIGFVPPQVMSWDRRHLEGNVSTRDIVATAKAYVPQMKEEGADIVIALSHSGIGSAKLTDMMENASVPLAQVDGIDAILTGHSHLPFPGPAFASLPGVDAENGTIHGKPAVMGGFWGSHLGVIDLMLTYEGGDWHVLAHEVALHPISTRTENRSIKALVEDDPEVLASVQKEHKETLAYVRRAVGKSDAPLHSYFALVADDPSVQLVCRAQKWYVAHMLKGTEHADLPILSAAAPFKAGGRAGPEHYTDAPAEKIAIKNVADLYLYPNTVRAVRVTGAQIKGWLERSAGLFNQIEAGKPDQMLLNPNFPSYNFDVIDGVQYQIDLSQPSRFTPKGELLNETASRIINLTYQGQPVTDEMKFIVATNSYRAGGGGEFPGAMGDTVVFEAPDTNRDVIVRYIVEKGTISPRADANWSFAPMPETSVLFDTGPKAERYSDNVQGLRLEHIGELPDGFARYRIQL